MLAGVVLTSNPQKTYSSLVPLTRYKIGRQILRSPCQLRTTRRGAVRLIFFEHHTHPPLTFT